MIAALRAIRALPRHETALVIFALVLLACAPFFMTSGAAKVASYSTYDYDSGGVRALYALLEREGARVERFERRAVHLDAAIATLVWIDPLPFDRAQRPPSRAEIAALERWTRAGGTFLYVGDDNGAAAQHLLGLPFAIATPTGTNVLYVAPWLRARGVSRIAAPGNLRWKAQRRSVLVADARGPVVVSYPRGRGRVIAVVDRELFSNAGIRMGDRARLAYALATTRGSAAPIAIDETTHGHFVPEHWWQVAPRPLVVAVLASIVVLAIAAFGAAVRLGPPIVVRPRDDATTNDFIGALAGLFQSGRAQRYAMLAASDSTTRALARSFGLGDEATASDVAECIDRPERRAAYATMREIARTGFADDANLVRATAVAQELRKDYAAHVDRRR